LKPGRANQNSIDEHAFADWAFGPDGILSLQFLVFGDFAHNGRYAKYNVLLCRDESAEGNKLLTPKHV
jgi:hypothetical protein